MDVVKQEEMNDYHLFRLIKECSELISASVKYWEDKDDKAEKKERTKNQ